MRHLISSVIGILTALVLFSFFFFLSIKFVPLPHGLDIQDINSITYNLDQIPIINFVSVLFCYALASFFAGFVSIKIKTPSPRIPLLIIGIVLTFLGFINFMSIPLPIWMIIIGSFTFLSMTWLGGKMGTPRPDKDSFYRF